MINNKLLKFLIALILTTYFVIAIFGIYLTYTYEMPNTNLEKIKPTPIVTPTPAAENKIQPTTTITKPKPTLLKLPTSTPMPTKIATKCGQDGGGCTIAEIKIHNKRDDCWVYLRNINNVYNITAYIENSSEHPGGDVIVPYCGKEIYDYFIGSAGDHRHSKDAQTSILQQYYIGPLL